MYKRQVARWAEVFGSENVSVIIVDEQKPELLFDSVNNYLELPSGFVKPQPNWEQPISFLGRDDLIA